MSQPIDTGVQLYNTLTKTKEALRVTPGAPVRIYVCGPTVYGRVHIGNARPFVVFSVLTRALRRRGLEVRFVSNLTDINDKIYDAARAEGIPSGELAERYSNAYIEDTNRLGLGRPDAEPKVTDTLPEIVALIEELIAQDLAYPAHGDVYFRVTHFAPYGELSGRNLDELISGEGGVGKEHPLDFALWKANKPGEDTSWPSPWGPGRPGWHIECSAMAEALLGRNFEIHGGGIDLIFPHHENEIAQSEGANEEPLAQIWMHNEMLELGGEKMAKSVGNIARLGDVLDEWDREVVVAYFLTSHYRSKLPFDDARLNDARTVCERIGNCLRALRRALTAPGVSEAPELVAALATAETDFDAALADDLNTPAAIAAIQVLVRVVNGALDGDARPSAERLPETHTLLVGLLDTLGLASLDAGDEIPAEVVALAKERQAARDGRDFARADALRDEIAAQGFTLRDGPDGPELVPA